MQTFTDDVKYCCTFIWNATEEKSRHTNFQWAPKISQYKQMSLNDKTIKIKNQFTLKHTHRNHKVVKIHSLEVRYTLDGFKSISINAIAWYNFKFGRRNCPTFSFTDVEMWGRYLRFLLHKFHITWIMFPTPILLRLNHIHYSLVQIL